jgi:hypothetical protein
MTAVTRKAHDDEDRLAWISIGRQALARAFSEEEAEYTLDDIKEGDVYPTSGREQND